MASNSTNQACTILEKRGVLSENPIENEYEDLDEGDDTEECTENEYAIKTIFNAQEPSTVSQYDDIKITPFNLEEELEEGEFDKTGTFVFKRAKKSDYDKNDTWAESIDWDKVGRKGEQKLIAMSIRHEERDFSQTINEKSRSTCYKQMLRIMRPDETVQKAIKRIGDSIPKKRTPHRSTTGTGPPINAADLEKVAESRRNLDLMIEAAHYLLEDGDTDVYQKSYEQLEEVINA